MLKKIFLLTLALCLLVSSASAYVYDCGDGRNVMLALGGSFVYARDTEGVLRVWGDNQFGQLGKGSARQNLKQWAEGEAAKGNREAAEWLKEMR